MKNKIFEVTVKETYTRVVEVLANSLEEAQEIVSSADIVMSPENYKEDSFQIIKTEESKETLDSINKRLSVLKNESKTFTGSIPDKTLNEMFYLEDRIKAIIKDE